MSKKRLWGAVLYLLTLGVTLLGPEYHNPWAWICGSGTVIAVQWMFPKEIP